MPFTKLIAKISDIAAPAWVYHDPGPVRLTNVFITGTIPYASGTYGFGIAGIVLGGSSYDSVIANLCTGWIDYNCSINWSGNILLEPDMKVFLRIRGPLAFTCNLHIFTELIQ